MIQALPVVSLIFGGCCTNVYTLEKLLKVGSDSGLLITFAQFALTALVAYPSQFSTTSFPVKASKVPFSTWLYIAALHGGINLLNNWAFAFNISVPVHIVLRSFGSVTTMIAGFIRGKRYSHLQVLSVAILTLGVAVSAVANAEQQGKSLSLRSGGDSSDMARGLGLLLLAQGMSAFMGAYVEDTYKQYGPDWTGNLFYSHFLSLPMFLPISAQLREQYARLDNTTHPEGICFQTVFRENAMNVEKTFPEWIPASACMLLEGLPRGVWYLVMNCVTQLLCITGVNLLSAKTSAVTVTIVLNIRKLVSFMLSTVLFGHDVSGKMAAGSALVFGAGALYGYETSWRIPQQRKAAEAGEQANGRVAEPNGSVGGKKA